ncbi:MAG: tetratricopeptide repeat protein [Microscillaceae bacterium]|nr:tetratricopeptide repeat protein [Microscillaceae bacterium]MDW8459767.1 tetratricopeptide repeat protein [Cytophagales bacterium]
MTNIEKIAFFGILFCFWINDAYGQCAKIDSLLRIIRLEKTEEGKIDAINKLAEVYASERNKSSEAKAHFYATQALKMAQKIKYKKGIADAMINIAYLDIEEVSKIEKAIEDYKQVLTIYEDMNDTENTIKMLNVIATYYARAKNIELQQQALGYYEKMLKILQKLKDTTRLAEVNEKLGEVYFTLKDDEKAIFFFKRALQLRKDASLNREANERILARYERIREMEKRIRSTDTFTLSAVFFAIIVVLLIITIYSWSQRNRALRMLKQNDLHLS